MVGVVIGSLRGLRAATASTIEFLRPIPSVALIPIAVLLYGAQLRSTLLLVVYAAFWPVLVQVLHGVADVDPVARDTALSYRFTPWAKIRYLVLPTALPYIMTGLRLSAAVALILAITAELVIGAPGLGKEIGVAMASSAVPTMYALILVIGVFGVVVNVAFRSARAPRAGLAHRRCGSRRRRERAGREAAWLVMTLALPALLFAAVVDRSATTARASTCRRCARSSARSARPGRRG